MSDEKPGMFEDRRTAAERVGAWVGLGLLVWAVLLGATVVTIKVIQSLF